MYTSHKWIERSWEELRSNERNTGGLRASGVEKETARGEEDRRRRVLFFYAQLPALCFWRLSTLLCFSFSQASFWFFFSLSQSTLTLTLYVISDCVSLLWKPLSGLKGAACLSSSVVCWAGTETLLLCPVLSLECFISGTSGQGVISLRGLMEYWKKKKIEPICHLLLNPSEGHGRRLNQSTQYKRCGINQCPS